ncbi:TPA: flagellar basal body P-ring formation protein FlgA [Pseudomonas aeruginosa]|nr:flagellar basal body P-ring formation protein FlgA [Pseudomonas aeruginosa]
MLGLGYLCAANNSQAQGFTAPEVLIGSTQGFLEFKVEEYLQNSGLDGRYQIQVNRVDPRLRLAECDRDLTLSQESPAQPIGRVTVRISCEGSAPWTIFMPAQVKLFRQVVVAVQPLKRAHVLEDADIALVERDVGLLTQGYLTDPARVVGQKLRRPVVNDQVVILARTATINVKMPGEALSDGAPGQQIRVRNLRSQRIIKARVIEPGTVEVNM